VTANLGDGDRLVSTSDKSETIRTCSSDTNVKSLFNHVCVNSDITSQYIAIQQRFVQVQGTLGTVGTVPKWPTKS